MYGAAAMDDAITLYCGRDMYGAAAIDVYGATAIDGAIVLYCGGDFVVYSGGDMYCAEAIDGDSPLRQQHIWRSSY